MSAKLRPVPAQRRMPVRTQTIQLTDEYEDWALTIRANAPAGVLLRLEGLADGDDGVTRGALSAILDMLAALTVAWNFVDEDGVPLPLERASFDRLPLDLIMAIMEEYKALGAVPKPSSAS